MKDSESLKNWLMSGKEELHFEIICKCFFTTNQFDSIFLNYQDFFQLNFLIQILYT